MDVPSEVELQRIVSYADELLDVAKYDEGEPCNGLMVDAGRPVTRLTASVNTSFESIRNAAAVGAELLLVHHPTVASIDRELKERKEEALRAAGVSLYGAHAALDCHPDFGNSFALARLLRVRILGSFVEYCGGLAGAYGDVDGSFDELVERIQATLEVDVDAWENSPTFGRVGIVAGGGPWTTYISEARSLGCDTYLTGEGSMYTKLFAKETGTNLIIATHYATETDGIQALALHLARQFQLPWEFVREDPAIQ
jgi:dinuclear metal center YbgI/SA1388 family protein